MPTTARHQELPDLDEGDQRATRLLSKAAPEIVALLAHGLRQGLKLGSITAVVSHRDAPFSSPQKAALREAGKSFVVFANTTPNVIAALRECAAGEAAEKPAGERLYGHYKTIAAELEEPCPAGCVRVIVCLEATTRLLDIDLRRDKTTDPATLTPTALDALASRLAGQLQASRG